MNIDTINPMTEPQLKGLSTILEDGYKPLLIQDSDIFDEVLVVWFDDKEGETVSSFIGVNGTVYHDYK